MHIQITNFHNISSLTYDIEDGKINFLYGVSGSGKSSIVKGVTQDIDREVDTMVGCSSNEEASVLINNEKGPLTSTTIFNQERQSVLFSPNADKGFYDLFIGNEEKLDTIRTQYQVALSSLQARTGDLNRLKNEVMLLGKTLGKAPKGHFTGTSKMGKAIKAYDSASDSAKRHIEQHGMAAATWIKDGFTVDDSYKKGTCPFCGQKLDQSPEKDTLAELYDLSVKDLKPLFDSPEQLAALGQDPIDLSRETGRQRAEELVNALPVVIKEIDRIVDYCDAGTDYETVKGMTVDLLSPDPAIFMFTPELREVIEEVNSKAEEVKSLLGKMKATFNAIVNSGCNELNHKLVKFGIPYRFELSTANREEKIASYRLVHINTNNSIDMRKSLSFGERNLITLILFLQDKEHEVMLIDDPASSYDDYRRTQIFKAIMETQEKTLLVVSHDQAFVRRAVWSREHQHCRIGKIDMLCNRTGRANVEPITKDSFGYFEDLIRDRIVSASTYYQRMLNARLLCEAHDIAINDKALWGYVSAILHQKSREEVLSLLADKDENEKDILDRLKVLTGENAAAYITPMPGAIDFSTESFSEFERLIALREEINRPKGGSKLPDSISKDLARELLNDLVHMNNAMMDCINPYRYPVWSPVLFRLLKQ